MSYDEPDGIVTPEAVLLEFGVAGLATRLLAKLIDIIVLIVGTSIVLWGAIYVIGVTMGSFVDSPDTVLKIVIVLIVFTAAVFVPIFVESLSGGSSLGKRLLGLRVVTTDGGPISFRHAAVRNLIQLLEIPTGLALVVALAGARTQRMGDLAAGTFVIKDITTSTEVQPVVFYPPRGLEAFTALLDVSRVTPPQFQAIRSFLLRVTQLDATARYSLSLQFAQELSSRTTPVPPAGIVPEFYLVCIASAYQERNGTLAHQQALRQVGWSA